MNDILRSIRKKTGLTQKEFAEKIGLKQNTYSMLESGKNKPKLDTLRKLVQEFDVDANILLAEYNDVIKNTVDQISEQIRETRNNIIKSINVDLYHSRRVHKILETKYPDLFKLKSGLENLNLFVDAIDEINQQIGDKVHTAFTHFEGGFNFRDYQKNVVETLAQLMPYAEPVGKLSDAINTFYKEMKQVPGNTIEFEDYASE